MAKFITTVFSGGNDVALQLGNEDWVRTMLIGSSWTHIRIGLLYQITATASTPASGASGFAIGVCAGATNPYGSTNTTNFVGVRCNDTLAWVANGSNPYLQFPSPALVGTKKIVNTNTDTSGLCDSAGMIVPTTSGNARRGLAFVDITKGSPNYTLGVMLPTNGGALGAAKDFVEADLIAGMTVVYGNQTISGESFNIGNGASTLAVNEAPGAFDTVNVYANFLNNPFNFYELMIEKLA